MYIKKRKMKHLLFVVSTVILISCGVSRGDSLEKNDDSEILLNDTWVVVSINGSAISLLDAITAKI